MAEPEVIIDEGEPAADEEMGEAEIEGTQATDVDDDGEPTGLEDIQPVVPERTTFLDFLRSPIVDLIIGSGDNSTSLFAHQALLTQSPFFEQRCAEFSDATQARRVELPEDDIDACSSVLEYLYKGDYFPSLDNQTLEYDPTVPSPDTEGVALLRHARVYTLAQRFEMPALCALARRKIHLTQSTAQGEMAYARYVYRETSPDDESVRKPVAAFWATRSHVLRHEAEQDFKRMCLEFPQFSFDVLSLVLDAQEKRSQRSEGGGGAAAGRKRQRQI